MNYAVLCDLNAINISFATFEKAVAQLDGRVCFGKFYGYNAKRNNDYTSYIRQHSCDVAVPLANRKKVRVDIRQVIDATTLANSSAAIDGFFVICSHIDALPMIAALKSANKKVVIGVTSKSFLSEQCDETIILDRTEGLDNCDVAMQAKLLIATSKIAKSNEVVEDKNIDKICNDGDNSCNASELQGDLAELQLRVDNAKSEIGKIRTENIKSKKNILVTKLNVESNVEKNIDSQNFENSVIVIEKENAKSSKDNENVKAITEKENAKPTVDNVKENAKTIAVNVKENAKTIAVNVKENAKIIANNINENECIENINSNEENGMSKVESAINEMPEQSLY
ncbi:MAG: hypothetical protein RR348_04755, partial [Clostridia bacterium]